MRVMHAINLAHVCLHSPTRDENVYRDHNRMLFGSHRIEFKVQVCIGI